MGLKPKNFTKSAFTYDGHRTFKIVEEKAERILKAPLLQKILGKKDQVQVVKKDYKIFCGPIKQNQHTISDLTPTTNPNDLPLDVQKFIENKWTPEARLTVYDKDSKKALTASEAVDKRNENPRWTPFYFQNPMQSYDYLVYESLIKNTILGPAMKQLIKYIMGTGFRPELTLRMPTKDKIKDKELVDKYQFIISQLEYVDRLVSERSDEGGIDSTFKTKVTNLVHNMLVFNRSCVLFVYDTKKPIKMVMLKPGKTDSGNLKGSDDKIKDDNKDGEEKSFPKIPVGLVDFHPRDMGIVKISPENHKMISLQLNQVQGMVDVDKMIYLWNSEYSAPIHNAKYYGGSMMMPMIDAARLLRNQLSSILPAVAENMAGGLYHIFIRPQGNTVEQKQQEYTDITTATEFGTSNVFMIDPADVREDQINFDPKISELVLMFDTVIKYILACANVPQIGFYDESAANHATAVEKIQLTISTIINPMRDTIGDEIARQWYDRIFKILYEDDEEILKLFRVKLTFDDMQVETLRERAEAIQIVESRGPKFTNQKYEEVIQITGYADNVEGDVITNEPGDEMDIKDSTDPNRTYQVKSHNRAKPGGKTTDTK